jgi:hypothetical protein
MIHTHLRRVGLAALTALQMCRTSEFPTDRAGASMLVTEPAVARYALVRVFRADPVSTP